MAVNLLLGGAKSLLCFSLSVAIIWPWARACAFGGKVGWKEIYWQQKAIALMRSREKWAAGWILTRQG
ncbi:MAG: hypothetical protein GY875_06620 [Gammaproteobacteria bacterium]|nr:hypothetical protein [Gammaproteobacteria bacterium]